MSVIVTKFLPATNTRGSRVKATAQGGSVTVGYDHTLGSEANHDAAAKALILKRGWCGKWVRGATLDGKGNVYVCITRFFDGTEILETGP